MNTHSITELTQRLITSLNSNYDIIDMDTVLYVIKELERTRITKEQLETTRIARYINQLRKRTKSENLAKRSKELLKKWHDIFIPIATTTTTTIQSTNSGVQFALIPETSTSRSQTNSRKKHQNGDNSNTFATANNNEPLNNNNISHVSNNFLNSTNNKLPTSFANLLPTSSANAIKNSQNLDMMVNNNDTEQNMSYLYYKNNSSKNLVYEYEQNSNQSAVDNSKNNRLYGTSTMQNVMDNKEYALNQASKNRLYESQNIFNAESITIGLSDSNSHKSFQGKDQQIPLSGNFQTGNEIMPVMINKLNKKHKKDKKQKRDKEKNLIQNKLVNSNNFPPRVISKCKNNAQNSYATGKINNLIAINEDDIDEIVLKTINSNQSIPSQYQQQQQQTQQYQQQPQQHHHHQQQQQQQNNRELLSLSNSSLSIFSIQNETNDDHDGGSSFNQKHMDLTFSGKFDPMSTPVTSRGNDLDTISNRSHPIELSSPGIKSCTNQNEYASIVILDESSRSCSPFTTNTFNNHLSKLPIELVSNVSRTQNLNENSQNSNMESTMLKRDVITINCDVNDKTVQNIDLADNVIKNSLPYNAIANKTTISEEKIPKKRGRKKGSKGIDSLLAQSIQYTKSSHQQLLDQSTRLLSGAATSMIIGGSSTSNKKVKTTKELLAAIQYRKAYGNSQQSQMMPTTSLSPTLQQYTEQQNQLQDSRPVLFCYDGSRSPVALETTTTIPNRINLDASEKGNSIENSIFVDDSTDSEATSKSNFNAIAKNGQQKSENDLEIKSTESSIKLQNDIAILSTEDKILQLFSQLPKMPKNYLNEVDLNYLNSIPCTCKIEELDFDLDKENLTENGVVSTNQSIESNKLDIINKINEPIDNSQKIKQYADFNLDVDGDKTTNSNDDWFITNLSNNNPCKKSPILENSNSIQIPDQLNFRETEKTIQYPIKRSIFDSDYDEADDPLNKLVEEQKKLKEVTIKEKSIKHKNRSKHKYTKSLDSSDMDAANSGNSFDSNENFDESIPDINLNSETLQNLDDSINFNSNFTSIASDFMEIDQFKNNKENLNAISPVKLTTATAQLGLPDNSIKLNTQENLPDAEMQNFKKLQVIDDENCLAKQKYILKPKNISLLYINLLHNYLVPNVNGNWSTLTTDQGEIENLDAENIEKSVSAIEDTIIPKSEETISKINGDLQLQNTDNSPLESLNLDASQICDRKTVIAPTDCIECDKKENSLEKLCETHSTLSTQIEINESCNEQLHERVVPIYSHLIQDKIQKNFSTLKMEELNLKINNNNNNNSVQRICLKCNKRRKFQFELNKPINSEYQNDYSKDNGNFFKSRLLTENENFNFTSYPSELNTKCDLLNNFFLLNNNNSITKVGLNDATINCPNRYLNDYDKNLDGENFSNKITDIDVSTNENYLETISNSNSEKCQALSNPIEFQNKVLTESDNTKETNELNSIFENDSNADQYEPQIKKIKLNLSPSPPVSPNRVSLEPSDLELKLNYSESCTFVNTLDGTEEMAPEKLRRSSNCSNTSLKQTQNSINLRLKSRLKEKQLRKENKEQDRSSDIEADDNYESPSSDCSDHDHLSDNCSSDDESNSSSCDDNSVYSTSSSDNREDDSERDDGENMNQDYHEVVRHDMKTSSKTGNKHIVLTIKKTPTKPTTTRILPTAHKTGALKLNIKIGGHQSNDSITEKNKSQRGTNDAVNQLENDDDMSMISDESTDDGKRISSKNEFNTNYQFSSKSESDDDDDKFQTEPLKIHLKNSCQTRKLERLSVELNRIDDNLNLNDNSKSYDLAPHNINLTRKYFRELRRKNRFENRMQKNSKESLSTESNQNELDENFQQLPTENQENNQELNASSSTGAISNQSREKKAIQDCSDGSRSPITLETTASNRIDPDITGKRDSIEDRNQELSINSNCHKLIPASHRERKSIRNRDLLFYPDEIHDQRSQLIFNRDCEDGSECSCSSCCFSSSESEDDLRYKSKLKILELETAIREGYSDFQLSKTVEHAGSKDDDEENYCKCSESETETALSTEAAPNTEKSINNSAAVSSELEPTCGDNNNNSDESLNKLDASCELNSDNCSSNRLVESKTDLELNTIVSNKNNDMLESFTSINLNEPEQLKYNNKEFKEWHEVLKLVSYDNQPLTILPYVIID